MALSYGIKPLAIKKALELYDILGIYLPEFHEDDIVLDFIGTIVENAIGDKSTAIIDAICLMMDMTIQEILDFPSEMQLKLFVDCLIVNDIVGLDRFCKDISYGR